ncbi:hypothetical protein ACH347_28625 [Saccharopolyspora sp. 5N102]|uniref:hypothetical protein n=1 Tax=Saccharopolyspora sp. 5N102 TaxID=3375155 RepID=UPI0037A6108D
MTDGRLARRDHQTRRFVLSPSILPIGAARTALRFNVSFLAARWAEEGVDLTRMLRKLLRWGRWRNNIGFLAELARHGVVLDGKLVDRAVRILCKVVSNPKSASREWQDCLTWLADLDEDRAATELEGLATTGSKHRRYEAVRELASLGAKSDQTRFDSARALARVNRSRGLAALRDLESDSRIGRSTREKATKAAERLDR